MDRFALLKKAARQVPAEAYIVDRPVDDKGQYKLELASEFPFAIKRLQFFADRPPRPLTWHTYLEIFILLSGECRIQMGDSVIHLQRGDLLVMDHLKLHALRDFPGAAVEAIIIRFLPDMALGLATSATDYLLLLPFYYQAEGEPHILRCSDRSASVVHEALARLFEAYSLFRETPYQQTGSRAYFVLVLHHLARYFKSVEELKEKFAGQQTKTENLRKLFEYIGRHYASRISLAQAATTAGLSKQRFNTVFKKATGMTLVAYLTQVRLAQASSFLAATNQSIADIASRVGFADQSYFDRRFRKHFGKTPRAFRQASGNYAQTPGGPNADAETANER